jgi:hypothetical protein
LISVGLWVSDRARVRYTEKCTLLLLTIHHQLIGRIQRSGYVSADETIVNLPDPDRHHKAQDAWLWTFLGPKADTIIFQFSLTRGAVLEPFSRRIGVASCDPTATAHRAESCVPA